jgi:hypothetical protein
MKDMIARSENRTSPRRKALRMKHKVPPPFDLHFQKEGTDSFFGFIQQGDEILMEVLGVNRDGTLDAYAVKRLPDLAIEESRLYCFAPDLKSFSPY